MPKNKSISFRNTTTDNAHRYANNLDSRVDLLPQQVATDDMGAALAQLKPLHRNSIKLYLVHI